jgi:hypothetical protein
MNARRAAADMVFAVQNDHSFEEIEAQIKRLQGCLLGLQAYGTISEIELEDYLAETDKIYSLVEDKE